MGGWKSMLKADPTDWLLERDNPSVRYFTLIDILERPDYDVEVRKTKREIMEGGIVQKILSKQQNMGNWEAPENFYIKSKYKGTVWQLIVLAELGADGNDEHIRKACEFIIENSQDIKSGGFSYRRADASGGLHESVLPCLTGNIIWSLIKFGYLDDSRVQRGIDWIVTYQRFDDGIKEAPKGWPYDKREKCWGRHTCHMGVAKALKALAEIPVNRRSEALKTTIERGVEHMLIHHIHKMSHDLKRISIPNWLKFGFPLMWNTDALEILGILTKLGYRDERMREAIDLVTSKQDDQGRWKLESTFNGRFQASIEQKDKPSRWMTLNALKVLKRYYC